MCDVTDRKHVHMPMIGYLGYKSWFAHCNCQHNKLTALVQRVGGCTPPVTQAALRDLAQISRLYRRMIGLLIPWTPERVVQGYSGFRRRRYEKALASFRLWGWHDYQGMVKMFVKLENKEFSDNKVNPDPRAIQYRDAVFQLVIACYIKSIEEKFYKMEFGGRLHPKGRIFAKGLNSVELAEMMIQKESRFRKVWVFGWDAERCDMHMSEAHLRVKHQFYLSLINNPDFARMLSLTRVNKGRAVEVSYTVRGGTMSGDMDTSLATNWLIASMMILIMKKLGVEYDMVINGDDSLLYVEEEDARLVRGRFRELALEFGMTMTLEGEGPSSRDVDFCQSRVLRVGGVPRVVRDYKKVTTAMLTSNKFWLETARPGLLKAMGMGELAVHHGVPILQEFAIMLIRSGGKFRPNRAYLRDLNYEGLCFDRGAKLGRQKPTPITSETRSEFEQAYGVSPVVQMCLEETFRKTLIPYQHMTEGCGLTVDWWFDPLRPEVL